MTTLETKRLILRFAAEDDFQQLLPLYNCQENMQYILDGNYHWTMHALKEKWAYLNKRLDEGYGLRMVADRQTGRVIGEGGILLLDRAEEQVPEIGFMLDKSQRGRGLGLELVQCLLQFAFVELQLPELRAGVLQKNIASRKLLEKTGFHFLYRSQNVQGLLLDYLRINSFPSDCPKPGM